MNNEFKKSKNGKYTVYTLESASSGGTSAGSVASVSMPMGGIRKRGDNLIAQEDNKTVEPQKPRNFVAKNAKMGGAGQHKDKKKAAKQGQEKHKKPFAEAAVAAQARPGAVKKGGTLQPWLQGNKGTAIPPKTQAAPAQPVTPPPPKLGTPPGSTNPADMAKLSATVPAYKAPAQPTTPPPPKLGTPPAATTTPPPPPSKPVPNAPAPTAPPVPGQAAAAPAKPNLGADFEAGLAAKKAGGSPTAMMLAQPSIGGDQRMLDAIAAGFGLPKGSTADDILAADAARSTVKEDHEIQMASSELQSIAKNAVNLLSLVRKYSENDGLEAWQQSKITKAADYLNAVLQSISGEQGVAEGIEDRTSYQVAKILSDKGIKYDPAHEGDLIKAIGMVLVKELNMSPKEARYLISYNEDFLSDTMSELSNMKNAGGDEYIESLAQKLAEKIPANAPVDVWVKDFQKADPNKYRQFKNKTPEKKAQMAVAASYAAKNPNKKK